MLLHNYCAGNIPPVTIPETREELNLQSFRLKQLLEQEEHLESQSHDHGVQGSSLALQDVEALLQRHGSKMIAPAYMVSIVQSTGRQAMKYTIRYDITLQRYLAF